MMEEEESLYRALQENMKSGKVLSINVDRSPNSKKKAQQLGAYVDRPWTGFSQSSFKDGTVLMVVNTPYDQNQYNYQDGTGATRDGIRYNRETALRDMTSKIGDGLKDVVFVGDFVDRQVVDFAKSHPGKRCWFFGRRSNRMFVDPQIHDACPNPSVTLASYTMLSVHETYLNAKPNPLRFVTPEGTLISTQRTSLDLPHCGQNHLENQHVPAAAATTPSSQASGARAADPRDYARFYQQTPSFDGMGSAATAWLPEEVAGKGPAPSPATALAPTIPDPAAYAAFYQQQQFLETPIVAPASAGHQELPFKMPFKGDRHQASSSCDAHLSDVKLPEVDFQNFDQPQTTISEQWNSRDQAALDAIMDAMAAPEHDPNQGSSQRQRNRTGFLLP